MAEQQNREDRFMSILTVIVTIIVGVAIVYTLDAAASVSLQIVGVILTGVAFVVLVTVALRYLADN